MKTKKLLTTAILAITSILVLSACSTNSAAAVEPAASTAGTPSALIREGVVKPIKTVDLGFFPSGGLVEAVDAPEGTAVKAGDVLAHLTVTPQQLAAVALAEQELVNATNALQKLNDEAALSKAQAAVDVALARETLNDAKDKKRDKDYTYRYSKTRESLVEKDKADANLLFAEQQLALAESNAAKWENGPEESQLAALTARLNSATEQVNSARAAAGAQSKIIAPWDGTVISNSLVAGQIAQSGQSYMQLADTSAWKVETSDLKESDIARVSVGTEAVITVDALPGVELKGKVVSIEQFGVEKQGDITYRAQLEIETNPGLLWNMTASILFK